MPVEARARKPIDVGNGLACASLGHDGCWLSFTARDLDLGLVELTAAPPFLDAADGRPVDVRRHRARLADPNFAFLRMQGARVCESTECHPVPGRPGVVQMVRVAVAAPIPLTLEFLGRLDRPAYAEITPVGPRPPTLGPSKLSAEGDRLVVAAGTGSARALITVDTGGVAPGRWEVSADTAVYRLVRDVPSSGLTLRIAVELHDGVRAESGEGLPTAGDGSGGLDRVSLGALLYTTGCTALTEPDGSCCIVTDHRLLPLSWTRDAYYQAALLLTRPELPAAVDVVRRHLRWLWSTGRDAAGVWQRSHFTDGRVKDPVFQADQQLYPLLELADFRRVTGQWPDPPSEDAGSAEAGWGTLVRQVWGSLPRDPGHLLPGDENPADDASELPYLLSSQLLLAYVARRLHEYGDEIGLADLGLATDADSVLARVAESFTCDGPRGRMWAYESDGVSPGRLYHDANDVPTALAPLWGLCEADDPAWLATMEFAWSSDNPGYVTGRLPGLGSAHAPGVWPLGDAQELAVSTLTRDPDRVAAVTRRVEEQAAHDGMLPETYDPETGEWLSRHWFAWPGALVGTLYAAFARGAGPWAVAW
jgi:hypothetical protein